MGKTRKQIDKILKDLEAAANYLEELGMLSQSDLLDEAYTKAQEVQETLYGLQGRMVPAR